MAFRTNKTPVLQTKSASGEVASFNTALAMPLVNGEFTIQAYQEGSGDPSPVNVRNIIPFNAVNMYKRGVNLWDEQWELGGYYNDTGLPRPLTDRIRCKNAIPIKQNTEIYTPFLMAFLFYDINNNVLPSVSRVGYSRADNMYLRQSSNTEGKFLIPQGAYYMRFYLQNTYGTTYNNDISINYPSTDKDYHAYNGETVTVALGEDVYGGVYNSVTGGKTDNRKKIFFSDYYVEVFAPYIKSDACDALITLPSNFQSVAYNNPPINIYCDNLKYERGHTIWATVGYPNCWQFNGRQIHINIANELLGITDYTQETTTTAKQKIIEWVTANNPYFVVPINNEITQLEPTPINTLNGDNNIFCDTGDTSVTYKDLDIAKRGNFREVFKLPS